MHGSSAHKAQKEVAQGKAWLIEHAGEEGVLVEESLEGALSGLPIENMATTLHTLNAWYAALNQLYQELSPEGRILAQWTVPGMPAPFEAGLTGGDEPRSNRIGRCGGMIRVKPWDNRSAQIVLVNKGHLHSFGALPLGHDPRRPAVFAVSVGTQEAIWRTPDYFHRELGWIDRKRRSWRDPKLPLDIVA